MAATTNKMHKKMAKSSINFLNRRRRAIHSAEAAHIRAEAVARNGASGVACKHRE
jgi:hypothetical protein